MGRGEDEEAGQLQQEQTVCVTAESGCISAKVAAQSGKTLREIAFSSPPLFLFFFGHESRVINCLCVCQCLLLFV